MTISFLHLGTTDYDDAMAKISCTEENFYELCLKQTINSLDGGKADFVATPEDDSEFSAAWLDAVDKKVTAAGELGVIESELANISDGVILELCQEINGARKLNGDEISLCSGKDDAVLDKKFSQTIEKNSIEENSLPDENEIQNIRTEIRDEMQKTSVYEYGGQFEPKSAEEAFSNAALKYCRNHPEKFTVCRRRSAV